jgi:hypothetical protein
LWPCRSCKNRSNSLESLAHFFHTLSKAQHQKHTGLYDAVLLWKTLAALIHAQIQNTKSVLEVLLEITLSTSYKPTALHHSIYTLGSSLLIEQVESSQDTKIIDWDPIQDKYYIYFVSTQKGKWLRPDKFWKSEPLPFPEVTTEQFTFTITAPLAKKQVASPSNNQNATPTASPDKSSLPTKRSQSKNQTSKPSKGQTTHKSSKKRQLPGGRKDRRLAKRAKGGDWIVGHHAYRDTSYRELY